MRSPVRIWIAAPHRGIAQLVEQRSPKPRAVSSKLTTPAITPGTLLGAPGVLFCRRALGELCHASEGHSIPLPTACGSRAPPSGPLLWQTPRTLLIHLHQTHKAPAGRRGLCFARFPIRRRLWVVWLVDEHRTQRVGVGADVSAQQLGDRQADVRHKGQQQQCNEHAQVERQG